MMKIVDLNLDCLLRIFRFCSEQDLMNLCHANSILRAVIECNIFYVRTLDLLMCGHRNSPQIGQRTFNSLSYAERLGIARNWQQGRYREYEYFHHAQMFATKLLLERNWLYVTHMDYVRQYGRTQQDPLQRRFQCEITSNSRGDVACIAKKRDTLFVGRVTGNCYIYENDYANEQQLHSAKEYLYCVDFESDMYVSSTNKSAKIWRRCNELGMVHLEQVANLQNAYKVMKLTGGAERLYGGLYTDVERKALRELDVESGIETVLNSGTLSVYDLKVKDEHVLLTANFDTTFRLYDRRTDRDEFIWEDPFDSSFYCLEYDGLYAVLCGAKYHSRVNLYDIRVPGRYQQLYFPRTSKRTKTKSSPVYSIACDSRYLFIATDHNLRVFDFKEDWAESHDYCNIFSEMRRYRNVL